MAAQIERLGFYDADQVKQFLAPGGNADLSGTFQPLNATLTALSTRSIGAASATDILDRAAGDGRYVLTGAAIVSSFNTRTGAVTLSSSDVTTALTYTPTSVTGLTGVQSLAAFKTGLSLVKADVGLGSVDNTADVAKNVLTATKFFTARTIDGQSFDGTANVTVIAPGTHAATSKTTPVDADELPLVDSAASNVLKKLTWANLKATLKTYFDTFYGLTPPAWTVTTPTPVANTGAFTTASSVIHAFKSGKSVHFSVNITITSIGTAPVEGAAGFCDVALPYASVASIYQSFGGRENGVTGKGMGATVLPGSTTLRFQRYDGTAMHGNGYVLTVTGVYEAA